MADLNRRESVWVPVASVDSFPPNGGACVKLGNRQIAIFNFARRGEWYACQNLCPHRKEMALSRGMVGSAGSVPKVACPYHKATFSLLSGECLSQELDAIEVFPVRIESDRVLIGLDRSSLDTAKPELETGDPA